MNSGPLSIDGDTKLCAIIGWPVRHSLSPRLFSFWLREHNVNGAMLPLAIKTENLRETLRSLAVMGFAGANLTLPHKEAALHIVDEVDKDAKLIGAVNAVTVREDLTLFGFNTDHYGYLESLVDQAPHWKPAAKPAIVLGAGGAARAVVHALARAGVREVRIVNRTLDRAQHIVKDFTATHDRTKLIALAWDEYPSAFEGTGLLVNTTQLGMTGQPPLDVELASLPKDAFVSDVVYRPLETDLLKRARARGHNVIDGLGMLLHQGRPGFHAWFGPHVQVTPALRTHMLDALV